MPGYIHINMKLKIILLAVIAFALIASVNAETFIPDEGNFAFREVETFEINGCNFTVPADYNVTFENATEMQFAHDKEKLKISVIKNGKIKKVKQNKSKNITSGKTMMGSQEGYLVDKNGTYTFSYKQDDKLVTIKSGDMALMIGVMGKD